MRMVYGKLFITLNLCFKYSSNILFIPFTLCICRLNIVVWHCWVLIKGQTLLSDVSHVLFSEYELLPSFWRYRPFFAYPCLDIFRPIQYSSFKQIMICDMMTCVWVCKIKLCYLWCFIFVFVQSTFLLSLCEMFLLYTHSELMSEGSIN